MGKKGKKRTKYRYKTKPYEHQVKALKKLLSLGFGGALLMEPRTGKTKVAIDYASVMHQTGHVSRVLVVCPNGVIGVWERELAMHCPFNHRVIVWDRVGRRRIPIPAFGHSDLVFVVINADAFSTPGQITGTDEEGNRIRSRSRGGRYDLKRVLGRWDPDLIILDESHRIKTPSARKTTMLWSLGRHARYRLILTGTPLTKKKRIYDIYSQWKFLNPDSPLLHHRDNDPRSETYRQTVKHTAQTFKNAYGRWVAMDGYTKWVGNRGLPRLHGLIHDESYAVKREECFDLPPRLPDQIVPVQLTGETAEVYDKMAEEMIAMLRSGELTEASIKLVQSLRLAQISGGCAKTKDRFADGEMVKGVLHRIGRDKLEVLESLLVDFYEAGEKVVIGARFRADIASIAALHRKLKVPFGEIHGGVERSDRVTAERLFREREGPGGFIMQPAAGSLGIDLSAASIFIWYSLTNSWVDFSQGEDRIALSKSSKSYLYLLAPGVDQVMYDTLQGDGDLAKAITERPERLRRRWLEDD